MFLHRAYHAAGVNIDYVPVAVKKTEAVCVTSRAVLLISKVTPSALDGVHKHRGCRRTASPAVNILTLPPSASCLPVTQLLSTRSAGFASRCLYVKAAVVAFSLPHHPTTTTHHHHHVALVGGPSQLTVNSLTFGEGTGDILRRTLCGKERASVPNRLGVNRCHSINCN